MQIIDKIQPNTRKLTAVSKMQYELDSSSIRVQRDLIKFCDTSSNTNCDESRLQKKTRRRFAPSPIFIVSNLCRAYCCALLEIKMRINIMIAIPGFHEIFPESIGLLHLHLGDIEVFFFE
jgi:hypothetical protein